MENQRREHLVNDIKNLKRDKVLLIKQNKALALELLKWKKLSILQGATISAYKRKELERKMPFLKRVFAFLKWKT